MPEKINTNHRNYHIRTAEDISHYDKYKTGDISKVNGFLISSKYVKHNKYQPAVSNKNNKYPLHIRRGDVILQKRDFINMADSIIRNNQAINLKTEYGTKRKVVLDYSKGDNNANIIVYNNKSTEENGTQYKVFNSEVNSLAKRRFNSNQINTRRNGGNKDANLTSTINHFKRGKVRQEDKLQKSLLRKFE